MKGKVALVTGGGMIDLFAAEGARVLTLEIRADWAKETEDSLRAAGFDVVGLAGDVTTVDDVRNAVARCVQSWGRLDILVNNAGVSSHADLIALPLADWDRVLDTNLKGPLICIQHAAPAMWIRRGSPCSLPRTTATTSPASRSKATAGCWRRR